MNEYERAQNFQDFLISLATGGSVEGRDYTLLRRYFLDNPKTSRFVPDWIRTNRNHFQLWSFFKSKFASYAGRRDFIWSEFSPLLDYLERDTAQPADHSISETLKNFDADGVQAVWTKALDRRETDPQGAITMSRTLLETVCKHILDMRRISYDPHKVELPELYRLVSKELNLAPSQHTQETFKKILGGVTSVVTELGSLRNRLGDAHGQGKLAVRPSPRHAELAVNLAGSLALFLVETNDSRR